MAWSFRFLIVPVCLFSVGIHGIGEKAFDSENERPASQSEHLCRTNWRLSDKNIACLPSDEDKNPRWKILSKVLKIRYLTGAEVCEYLHISPRTLQTLRDTRQIPFTVVSERNILYPESAIRETLTKNYRPTQDPF